MLGFTLATAIGCGSSGSSVDRTAAIASCNAYCDMFGAAACPAPALYASAADCKTNNCTPLSSSPAGCQTALVTFYDCEKTQADICADDGCDTQFAALTTCK